jgi:hypothetical protein
MAKRKQKPPYPDELQVVIPDFITKLLVSKKSKKTGKPRYWTINGQSLYSGVMNHHLRSKLMKELKAYLSGFIKASNIEVPEEWYGHIKISLEIHQQKKGPKWDCDNKWIWHKAFQDALVLCSIIPDDNIDYVISGGETRFVEIEDNNNKKLVFKIEKI